MNETIPYNADKTVVRSDEEICRLWDAGDWQGMELMFRTYYKRLVVWADTFIEDMSLAEDIVQELFTDLWENKGKRQLKSSTLSSFLFVSVRNQCYHRMEKKDVLRHTVDLKEVDAAFEEYNEKHEYILSRVLNEIKELPPRSQEVMTAVFVNGLKYQEVAEKYDISLSTVKTLVVHSIRKLKEKLGTSEILTLLFLLRIKN